MTCKRTTAPRYRRAFMHWRRWVRAALFNIPRFRLNHRISRRSEWQRTASTRSSASTSGWRDGRRRGGRRPLAVMFVLLSGLRYTICINPGEKCWSPQTIEQFMQGGQGWMDSCIGACWHSWFVIMIYTNLSWSGNEMADGLANEGARMAKVE